MSSIRRVTRPPAGVGAPDPDRELPAPAVADPVEVWSHEKKLAIGCAAWLALSLPVVLAGSRLLGAQAVGPEALALVLLPVLLAWGVQAYLASLPSDRGSMRLLDRSAVMHTSRYELAQLGTRRGLKISLSFQAAGQAGRKLEVVLRLRSPRGHYLVSRLQRYRGEDGELLLRHRTGEVRYDPAYFADLWLFVPTRALPIGPGDTRFAATAEVLVASEGRVLFEADVPIDFEVTPADLPLPAVESSPPGPGGDPAIQIVATEGGSDAIQCGVCGEGLSGPTTRCRVCSTPHHSDCWEFLGGCSIYACEGRPRS
jgi:hypothetical protein